MALQAHLDLCNASTGLHCPSFACNALHTCQVYSKVVQHELLVSEHRYPSVCFCLKQLNQVPQGPLAPSTS
jgi:hypothetical protein